MRILLDTHVFLWWADGSDQLSARASRLIGDPRNEVLVSAVTVWEIVLKEGLGRLTLPDTPERFVPDQLRVNGFGTMALELSHSLAVSRLPAIHRDPFDRALIAQAQLEDLTFVTADEILSHYPVKAAW
jgi:PIN domain nuclease of toxin-antitoxin system